MRASGTEIHSPSAEHPGRRQEWEENRIDGAKCTVKATDGRVSARAPLLSHQTASPSLTNHSRSTLRECQSVK